MTALHIESTVLSVMTKKASSYLPSGLPREMLMPSVIQYSQCYGNVITLDRHTSVFGFQIALNGLRLNNLGVS